MYLKITVASMTAYYRPKMIQDGRYIHVNGFVTLAKFYNIGFIVFLDVTRTYRLP